MKRVELLIVQLLEPLDRLVLLNEHNILIRVQLEFDDMSAVPAYLVCRHVPLRSDQQLQEVVVAQQLARVVQHEFMHHLQINIFQQLTPRKLLPRLTDLLRIVRSLLRQLLPRQHVHQIKGQREEVLYRLDLIQRLVRGQRSQVVLTLTSLIAEDVPTGFNHIGALLHQAPEGFDHPFSIEQDVLVVTLPKRFNSIDTALANLLHEHALLDNAAWNRRYRSRIIRFLRM
jgi:hypothetical protein